jgi:BirA family biotin operon repressor/biotin-[acetyl-CoA-carboxylase] ligase
LAVVVGIGINITSANIQDPIRNTATSIEAETGSRISADDLAENLTRYLSYFEAILSGPNGPHEILQHWRQRSTYFSGKQVRVTTAHGPIDGVTDGLEENGSLRVKTTDGSVKIIQAGDVERVRPHDK